MGVLTDHGNPTTGISPQAGREGKRSPKEVYWATYTAPPQQWVVQNWLVSSFTAAFAADDDTPWILR